MHPYLPYVAATLVHLHNEELSRNVARSRLARGRGRRT